MRPTHQDPLYPDSPNLPAADRLKDFGAELVRLSALRRPFRGGMSSTAFHRIGRNRLTRTIDTVLNFMRRYLPPIHWTIVRLLALLLYGYARAVRATAEIVAVGSHRWPDIPPGSVLTIWHGSAPSLLVAFNARKPAMPVSLMVSSDPRGDCVAVFCRWLGFEIVRGDAQNRGWAALMEIANHGRDGAAALIIPDGGGPPLFARVGAAALASATGRPLIPVGAACRPSLFERHKWDKPRNPLPYGRISVACGPPLTFPSFEDAVSLENARKQLQDALDRAADEARAALGFKVR